MANLSQTGRKYESGEIGADEGDIASRLSWDGRSAEPSQPEEQQLPDQNTPEARLEKKFAVSEDVMSAEKQADLREKMYDNVSDLYDNEGTAAGIASGFRSGQYNSELDEAIMDAAEIGDDESAQAIIKWKDDWNAQRQSLIEKGDPNVVQSALFQAAESAPYMLKIGLATGASKAVAGVTGKVIAKRVSVGAAEAVSIRTVSMLNKKGLAKLFAPILSRTAARIVASDAILTPAQAAAAATGAGVPAAVVAEVAQWAVIGGMLVWDAIQLTRVLSKDEETGLTEAKSLPFMMSPMGRGASAAAKQMAGAHYTAQVHAGIDPQFINKDAAKAVGLLQGAIESIFNPFQITGPAVVVANKAFGKLFASSVAQQGSTTLRLLNITGRVAVVGGTRALGEMEEEGAQAVAGQYYLSKEVKNYLEQHPEVATTSAAYAGLSKIADTSARDMVELFVSEAKAAGPVSLVFSVMGLPMYGAGLIRANAVTSVKKAVKESAEAEVSDLTTEQLSKMIQEIRSRNTGGFEKWSYEDVVRARTAAEAMEKQALEEGDKWVADRAASLIASIDTAEIQGDTVAFLEDEIVVDQDAVNILLPENVTLAEAKDLFKQIVARRKESERRPIKFDEFIEAVYGKNAEFKAEESEKAEAVSSEAATALKAMRKAVAEGRRPWGSRRAVIEAYGETAGIDGTMTDSEILEAIDAYEEGEVTEQEQIEGGRQRRERKKQTLEQKKANRKLIEEKIQIEEGDKKISLESFRQNFFEALLSKKEQGSMSVEEAYEIATGNKPDVKETTEEGESIEDIIARVGSEGLRKTEAKKHARTAGGRAILNKLFPDAGFHLSTDKEALAIVETLTKEKKIGPKATTGKGESVQAELSESDVALKNQYYEEVSKEIKSKNVSEEQREAAKKLFKIIRHAKAEDIDGLKEAYKEHRAKFNFTLEKVEKASDVIDSVDKGDGAPDGTTTFAEMNAWLRAGIATGKEIEEASNAELLGDPSKIEAIRKRAEPDVEKRKSNAQRRKDRRKKVVKKEGEKSGASEEKKDETAEELPEEKSQSNEGATIAEMNGWLRAGITTPAELLKATAAARNGDLSKMDAIREKAKPKTIGQQLTERLNKEADKEAQEKIDKLSDEIGSAQALLNETLRLKRTKKNSDIIKKQELLLTKLKSQRGTLESRKASSAALQNEENSKIISPEGLAAIMARAEALGGEQNREVKALTEEELETRGLLHLGETGKGKNKKTFHAVTDMSTEGVVVTEIPAEFLDKDGNLKPSVVVRRVLVTKQRYLWDDGKSNDHSIVRGMQALQLDDEASLGKAYNFAVISPTGKGFPATQIEGTPKLTAPVLGFQDKANYMTLDLGTINETLLRLTTAAGMMKSELNKVGQKKQNALTVSSARVEKKKSEFKRLQGPLVKMEKLISKKQALLKKSEDKAVQKKLRAEIKTLKKELAEKSKEAQPSIDKLATEISKELKRYQDQVSELEAKYNAGLLEEEIEELYADGTSARTREVNTMGTAVTAEDKWIKQTPAERKSDADYLTEDEAKADWDSLSKKTQQALIKERKARGTASVQRLAYMIWRGARNARLRQAYEDAVGKDMAVYEGGARDANAESLLSQIIRDEVMAEQTGEGTGKIMKFLRDEVVAPQALFKALSKAIKERAREAIGEIHGEKAQKQGIDRLRSLDTDSRKDMAVGVRKLLDDPFLYSEERREQGTQEERQHEALTSILDTMLSTYGILKQEWIDFKGVDILKEIAKKEILLKRYNTQGKVNLAYNAEKAINELKLKLLKTRNSTSIYKALMGDGGDIKGLLDLLGSTSTQNYGTAWNMLRDTFGTQKEVGSSQTESGFNVFRELMKKKPDLREPSAFRPKEVVYKKDENGKEYVDSKTGNKNALALLTRHDKGMAQSIGEAAFLYRIRDRKEALLEDQAKIESEADQIIEASKEAKTKAERDEILKPLKPSGDLLSKHARNKGRIALLEAKESELVKKLSPSLVNEVALNINLYKAQARIYSAQRRLTLPVLNALLGSGSPFLESGSTSFSERVEESKEVSPAVAAITNDRETAVKVKDAAKHLENVVMGIDFDAGFEEKGKMTPTEALLILEDDIRRTADKAGTVTPAMLSAQEARIEAGESRIVAMERSKDLLIEASKNMLNPKTIRDQKAKQAKALEDQIRELNDTVYKDSAVLARMSTSEHKTLLAEKARAAIEQVSRDLRGSGVSGKPEFSTEKKARDRANELRKEDAETMAARHGGVWAKTVEDLDGDFSVKNVGNKLRTAEKKALDMRLRKVKGEKAKSIKGEVAALRALKRMYDVQKVTAGKESKQDNWKVMQSADSAVRRYQEFQNGELLTEAEYERSVQNEATRFGLRITKDEGGMVLTHPKSGKTLRIQFHAEGLEKGKYAGITDGDLIQIASVGANEGTVKHELVEWAYDALLTDSERKTIIDVYKNAHEWANAMQDYKAPTGATGRRMNVIMNKVRNFFRVLVRRPPIPVDEFSESTEQAELINMLYDKGALHGRTLGVTDTTKISELRTKEELAAMSRSELQAAFRAHSVMLSKSGITLKTKETSSTAQLIYHMTRPDHYFVAALNNMQKTSSGRKAIKLMTNPVLSSQLSPNARLEVIANFDQSGVTRRVIDNLKSAESNKVAPIRERLEAYMADAFPAAEANKQITVTVGGKKFKITGHAAISIVLAASNENVRAQMLKNNLQFRDVISGKLTKNTTSLKPITVSEIEAIKKMIPSADKIIKQWGYMTDDISRGAGALVNRLVAQPAGNYLNLKKKWVHEANWFPTIWGNEMAPVGASIDGIMSAKESWMSAKEAKRENSVMVMPEINEVLASHANSAARFMGMAMELQNYSDLIHGVSGSAKFYNSEALKGWDSNAATRMTKDLKRSFDQTVQAGRQASGIVKSPLFKFLKAGQDLYRLANPVTMLRMASSSHLIVPMLADPKNYAKALATPKQGATVARWFKSNAYQYSRGNKSVVPDVGDTHSRTKGRSILQGDGGLLSTLRHLPAKADRVAMRTIFLASAFDTLSEQNVNPSMAELEKRKDDMAFWQQVSEKANSLTMETQPTFESFMRSDLLNRGNFGAVVITRYGTQRNRMLNMLSTSYAKMELSDDPVARKNFEKTVISVVAANTVLMASIAAGDVAFKALMRSLARGDEDDDMLYGYEKDRSLKKDIATAVIDKSILTPLTLLEGSDELVSLIKGGYGAVTGSKHLQDRALRGMFAAGEVAALYGVLASAGSLARQKKNMEEASTMGAYMTAKRSYAHNAGKLYRSTSQLVGVGLHLPTRMLDSAVNPSERIRKATFER